MIVLGSILFFVVIALAVLLGIGTLIERNEKRWKSEDWNTQHKTPELEEEFKVFRAGGLSLCTIKFKKDERK